MKLRPDEITKVLRAQIEQYEGVAEADEVGTVLQVGDGIARVHGLPSALALEMLELPHGVSGLALNLEEDNVGVVLLGDDVLIKEGDPVRRTGKVIQVPVGEALLGRVVNRVRRIPPPLETWGIGSRTGLWCRRPASG